jgi:hypothetical protein
MCITGTFLNGLRYHTLSGHEQKFMPSCVQLCLLYRIMLHAIWGMSSDPSNCPLPLVLPLLVVHNSYIVAYHHIVEILNF